MIEKWIPAQDTIYCFGKFVQLRTLFAHSSEQIRSEKKCLTQKNGCCIVLTIKYNI